MANDDIVKCKHCDETLIFEEFDSHVCSPLLNGKTVKAELSYYIIIANQIGEPTILAKDMDGTLCTLTLTDKRKEFFSPSQFHQDLSN